MSKNRLQAYREEQLLTKAELARKAGVSPLTIDRIEAGLPCRMDTKRKIILALGLKVTDKDQLFDKDGLPLPAQASKRQVETVNAGVRKARVPHGSR